MVLFSGVESKTKLSTCQALIPLLRCVDHQKLVSKNHHSNKMSESLVNH